MINAHKVAFIGPLAIHQAFQQMDETWDFQVPLATLEEFEKEINSDNSRISDETSLIIIFSRLFDSNPDLFANTVAFLSAYSVVSILIPEDDIKNGAKREIESAIRSSQEELSKTDSNYNMNIPFYFVNYNDPQIEIFHALQDFCKNPFIEKTVRDSVERMLPKVDVISSDMFEDFGEDYGKEKSDKIVIPKPAEDAKGVVYVVTSPKGGTGKSTVSINLGVYFAKASKLAAEMGKTNKALKVCVVDLDVRDGQIGFFVGSMTPTIIDIIFDSEEISVNNVGKGIYTKAENTFGCHFLFAPKRPRFSNKIEPESYAKVIQVLRSLYDIIILDTSVNYMDELLEQVAYPIADKVICVTDMVVSSVFGCSRWITETTESEENPYTISRDKVGIIINRAIKECKLKDEQIIEATKGLPILTAIPNAPITVVYATNTLSLYTILDEPGINQAFWNAVQAIKEDYMVLEKLPCLKD